MVCWKATCHGVPLLRLVSLWFDTGSLWDFKVPGSKIKVSAVGLSLVITVYHGYYHSHDQGTWTAPSGSSVVLTQRFFGFEIATSCWMSSQPLGFSWQKWGRRDSPQSVQRNCVAMRVPKKVFATWKTCIQSAGLDCHAQQVETGGKKIPMQIHFETWLHHTHLWPFQILPFRSIYNPEFKDQIWRPTHFCVSLIPILQISLIFNHESPTCNFPWHSESMNPRNYEYIWHCRIMQNSRHCYCIMTLYYEAIITSCGFRCFRGYFPIWILSKYKFFSGR